VDNQKDSKEFSTQTTNDDQGFPLPNTCEESPTIQEMMDKIKRLESEIIILSKPKKLDSVAKNAHVETGKLRKAEIEIRSLTEQNRIISAENQKLIVHAACKREDVTREREVLYGLIHDFVANHNKNNHSFSNSIVDQMSKNLYSLIEHSNDVSQLNRIQDLFLSFSESIVKIANESNHLDLRISNLANSSNAIRMESETIISQLEEKLKLLTMENKVLQQKIQDIETVKQRSDDTFMSAGNAPQELAKKDISTSMNSQDQEIIKTLKLENEALKMKLLNNQTPAYPLSDLYEKIVTLLNRDAASGINIKEILEWVEEKRVVIEELEKIKTSYSSKFYYLIIDLSFKHKHLMKEYSDQKLTMDEIQKRITVKESEWQSKFKEFAANANQLEARHTSLESILCDYAVQFQGVISLLSESSDICTSDHPLPFLKCFGNLQKSNSSLDHSLQHASSALSESQRATHHALQNLDLKHAQIINLEREKQEIATLISKFKSEISAKDKEMSAVKSANQQLQDRNLRLSDKLKRIAEAFKWTMT
jgi:hypothetical protein